MAKMGNDAQANALLIAVAIAVFVAIVWVLLFTSVMDIDMGREDENYYIQGLIEKEYIVNDGYHPMVIGPTTPGESSMGGGMWFILAHPNGTIYMDFAIKAEDRTPFEERNMSLVLNLEDYGLEPPLSEVRFLAPARGFASISDMSTPIFEERVENGLLAFVADTTFVILDPFRNQTEGAILFSEDIGFAPRWIVHDTTSAGEMLNPPTQRKSYANTWFPTLEGPFRYVTLAHESQFITYRFEYCWNSRGISNVNTLVKKDMPVTQEPLNYKFDNIKYTANATGVYIPSTDGEIHFFNGTTDGSAANIIRFKIDGEPVEFTAPIGFYRSMDFNPRIYVPTAVGNDYSVKIYDLGSNILLGEAQGGNGLVETSPCPTISGGVYFAINNYNNGNPVSTTILRADGSGAVEQSFRAKMRTVARNVVLAENTGTIFTMDMAGKMYVAQTAITAEENDLSEYMIPIYRASEGADLHYLGSLGGTKYSTTLASVEMYIFYFDPALGTAGIFQPANALLP